MVWTILANKMKNTFWQYGDGGEKNFDLPAWVANQTALTTDINEELVGGNHQAF